MQMLQICIRRKGILLRLRKGGQCRRESGIKGIHLMNPTGFTLRNLFFEERVEHDRGAPCVFEPPHRIQVIGER